jgi:spermidine/putrescine transport system ATP-binding protein
MSDRIAVMSQGVALQVGNANDIYEHPNCKFVADFIGDTNFLDGTVVEKDGARVRVELKTGGGVWATTAQPLERGRGVSITVRPEKMQILGAGAAGAAGGVTGAAGSAGGRAAGATGGASNLLHGHVTSVVYIGTDTHYGVTLPDGQEVRVREQNSSTEARVLAKEGDAATVQFTPEAARVLTE